VKKPSKAVIQQETTGCAIASAAVIAGTDYQKAKTIANQIGIYATDDSIWSDTQPIRSLLKQLDIQTAPSESPFTNWDNLPDCALVSLKWHLEKGQPYWHWAVFIRDHSTCYVLDSSKRLKHNYRTDFGRMKPKWFIEVYPSEP
jgi:hypothetical protein